MSSILVAPPVEIRGNLDPYTGTWDKNTARHLLKRAMFAPNATQIAQAVTDGLDLTIQKLFAPAPDPGEPINYNEANDPNVPVGSSWVYAAITQGLNYPQRSIRAWQLSIFLNEGVSIREKMVLFWHNHFPTANANIVKMVYQYIKLLRDNATGNFRTLVEEMTVNPLMLLYLNGNESNKNAPNENYARELLELFTIGKGVDAGPGDYTNYTEQDIKEIARALTGWTSNGEAFRAAGPLPNSVFRANRHDTGTKTLSNRFGNAVISNLGDQEYKKVIEIILAKDEVSRFMARNLYRWFVYYFIDDEIESSVIEPLAEVLRQGNYEIQPALSALLKSEHFYHENAIGAMIKAPVDFTMSTIKPFGVTTNFNLNQTYQLWLALHNLNTTLQQDMFTPPDVAGWKAYYQEPVFYRNWINSVTLTTRRAMTDGMATSVNAVFNRPYGIDVLKVVDAIPNSTDPNDMILALVDLVLPYPLTQAQLDYLKDVLIPGLPDFEWNIEYGAYLNDPTNDTIRMGVENRLKALFMALLGLPEFQLQ
ncbi:MAG TPA: DUF1800 domain-containing protein [Saprospiraceae bacterium]|nr:DUF1800 domain-containing protein [Saprospiraceae bacterium]